MRIPIVLCPFCDNELRPYRTVSLVAEDGVWTIMLCVRCAMVSKRPPNSNCFSEPLQCTREDIEDLQNVSGDTRKLVITGALLRQSLLKNGTIAPITRKS